MALMRLVKGLPTMIQPYSGSIYYSTGLAANTSITLPSSGSYNSSTALDLIVILNDRVLEVTRDFTVVGSAPYTQIQIVYALNNDSVVRFQQIIG